MASWEPTATWYRLPSEGDDGELSRAGTAEREGPELNVAVQYHPTGPGSIGAVSRSLKLVVRAGESVQGLKAWLHTLLGLPAERSLVLHLADPSIRLEVPIRRSLHMLPRAQR